MKNLIKLAADVMEVFNINYEVSSIRIFTNDAKESIIKIGSKTSLEDNWENGNVENFLQSHPAVRLYLEDSWSLRIKVPEWYSGIKDFNIQSAEMVIKDLPGNVKSYEILFDNPITLPDFKYYAVKAGFVDLEDTDFSVSSNSVIVFSYDCQRSVSITLDADEKSGIITIIDHR